MTPLHENENYTAKDNVNPEDVTDPNDPDEENEEETEEYDEDSKRYV